ncbi:MAG: hypothetical protein QMD14_05830 [Candidatus Aenigmarchaeota archaeon]|nr:hypothetical protein [Candidatus Aenigmarchaeota archaeon]
MKSKDMARIPISATPIPRSNLNNLSNKSGRAIGMANVSTAARISEILIPILKILRKKKIAANTRKNGKISVKINSTTLPS